MASLRVISSSSGKRIEPEGPTSLAEESNNSSMVPTWEGKRLKSQIKCGGFFRLGSHITYEGNALAQAHEVRQPPHLIRLFVAVPTFLKPVRLVRQAN